MQKNIEVVPYHPEWPKLFELESALLKYALGKNCSTVHHIGSTSVPGLCAKPILDILPVVRSIQAVDKAAKVLEALGYEAKGEYGIAFRRFFKKRMHNVHIYQEGDPEISRYLKFRDWMRSHADDAARYAKLKIELAAKFPEDILQYCNGKDSFVAHIDAKDGFDGWRMVQALTDREWSAVQAFRQECTLQIKEDHQDHIHFVFYKNAEIVGYAHLQLGQEKNAALPMLVIDKQYRERGFGSQFLKLCERWLYHRGFKKLLVQSSPETCKFYRHHGYADKGEMEMSKFLIMNQNDRPKISVYIATSIDGYIARKDGGLDWLERDPIPGEDYGFKKFIDSIDALVLGRNTYEVVSGFDEWPYKGKRVIVLSRTLNAVREEAELFDGELTQLASALHADGIKHVWVDGGITVTKFLEAGLVDQITLSVLPVVLGSGIPLFSSMNTELPCRLTSTQSYPSGLVQLRYDLK